MVAWHEVPGMRKKKEPVPEGRCDYVFARWSTKIVWAFAKFGDGLVSGSYTIIPSLRDGSLLFYSIPGTSCQATLMSPSGTISRRPITVNLALKGFSPGSSGVLELRRASTAVW
jgi:hypothetical protein